MQQHVADFGEELKRSFEEIWFKPAEEATQDSWATRMEEAERERRIHPIDKVPKPELATSNNSLNSSFVAHCCATLNSLYSQSYLIRSSVTDDWTLAVCSKHILNAQVSIRAPCCRQWYDCAECHAERQTHPLAKTTEIAFMYRKYKKAFRKDISTYEDSDEYCPHCDNHYVIEAKTLQAVAGPLGLKAKTHGMLKDDPSNKFTRSIFADEEDLTDRLDWS
ncbi:hypothetical protein DXG03_008335 [Asterophora parasitica]|uniref:CHY-type domain-containing protein n=1 Tax=Asterophora parasitica TaxID=117018 RepID=A0A9P7G0F7_9AGAR|nr:hypothetical protein DXG03_008335 [Asterophora parasitica]